MAKDCADGFLAEERVRTLQYHEQHTAHFKQESAMRSTRASAAVARLNTRDGNYRYSLGINAAGLFYLLRAAPGAAAEKISSDLALDEFVEFVDRTGPQKKVKISKHDSAFERQLARRGKE
jgi:hypothetical protein